MSCNLVQDDRLGTKTRWCKTHALEVILLSTPTHVSKIIEVCPRTLDAVSWQPGEPAFVDGQLCRYNMPLLELIPVESDE